MMIFAIYFYYQPFFQTDEVHDVVSYDMLSIEFNS